MIKQFKLYIYGGLAVLIVGMAITVNILLASNKKMKADIARLESNNSQLMDVTNKFDNLTMTIEEMKKSQVIADSTLKAMNIKWKQIENVTNIKNTYIDTTRIVYVPVEVITDSGSIFPIAIDRKCLKIALTAQIKDNKPIVTLESIKFENNITLVAYWYRPNKFLGIKYGRKQYTGDATATCGDVKVVEITVKKKKE